MGDNCEKCGHKRTIEGCDKKFTTLFTCDLENAECNGNCVVFDVNGFYLCPHLKHAYNEDGMI